MLFIFKRGDGGDDGGGEETQYFTDLPDQTGESSLIIIQEKCRKEKLL